MSKLQGLVYSETPLPREEGVTFCLRPIFWAAVVFVFFIILNILFW